MQPTAQAVVESGKRASTESAKGGSVQHMDTNPELRQTSEVTGSSDYDYAAPSAYVETTLILDAMNRTEPSVKWGLLLPLWFLARCCAVPKRMWIAGTIGLSFDACEKVCGSSQYGPLRRESSKCWRPCAAARSSTIKNHATVMSSS
jgi:hypothetical protein